MQNQVAAELAAKIRRLHDLTIENSQPESPMFVRLLSEKEIKMSDADKIIAFEKQRDHEQLKSEITTKLITIVVWVVVVLVGAALS
jgi:hypothetical protein